LALSVFDSRPYVFEWYLGTDISVSAMSVVATGATLQITGSVFNPTNGTMTYRLTPSSPGLMYLTFSATYTYSFDRQSIFSIYS